MRLGGRKYRSFDARQLVPTAAGTLPLPSWLSYECATAETSAQTGPATVRTGFAADAPRAFSRDGVTWGLLIEPAATNLIDEQDLTAWASVNTPVLSAATTPSGTSEQCEIEDDNAAGVEYKRLLAFDVDPNPRTLSLSGWMQHLGGAGIAYLRIVLDAAISLQFIDSNANADWVARAASGLVDPGAGAGSLEMRASPRNAAAEVGSARYWGMQLEERAYPTSFIGADNATFTRAASQLEADVAAIVPRGRMAGIIRFRPHYSSAEVEANHNLIAITDGAFANIANIYYSQAFGRFQFDYPAGSVNGSAVTFSRHQELMLYYEYTANRIALEVLGCTTGNGRAEAASEAALASVAHAYVLGGSGGTEQGADLRRLSPLMS